MFRLKFISGTFHMRKGEVEKGKRGQIYSDGNLTLGREHTV